MKFWKKIIIIIILLLIPLIFLLIEKNRKITNVFLKDYEVSPDGKTIKIEVGVSSSMGYIKNIRVTQGAENQYITFYSTFGLNNEFNSNNEFEVELDPLCQKIYFYEGDDKYHLVLQKNQSNGWENQSTVDQNLDALEKETLNINEK